MGTIQTALAAISAVHSDGAAPFNPTHGAGVKARLKGAERFVLSSKKGEKLAMSPELFLLLLRLTHVPGWSRTRLLRAKMMMIVGFCCYLRRREILELDVCVFAVAPDAFEVTVCGSKNDQLYEGRQSFIGRGAEMPHEIEDVCGGYMRLLGDRRSCACTTSVTMPLTVTKICHGPHIMNVWWVLADGRGGGNPALAGDWRRPLETRWTPAALPGHTGALMMESPIISPDGNSHLWVDGSAVYTAPLYRLSGLWSSTNAELSTAPFELAAQRCCGSPLTSCGLEPAEKDASAVAELAISAVRVT